MFVWVRGTILGREVVPEVCNTRATSLGWENPPCGAAVTEAPSSLKRPASAPSRGVNSIMGIPRATATALAGESRSDEIISALAFKSVK